MSKLSIHFRYDKQKYITTDPKAPWLKRHLFISCLNTVALQLRNLETDEKIQIVKIQQPQGVNREK